MAAIEHVNILNMTNMTLQLQKVDLFITIDALCNMQQHYMYSTVHRGTINKDDKVLGNRRIALY